MEGTIFLQFLTTVGAVQSVNIEVWQMEINARVVKSRMVLFDADEF